MLLTKVNNHDPRRRGQAHPCRQAAWVGGGGIHCADAWITDIEELFMKTVIEMAREAGAVFPADGSYHKFESVIGSLNVRQAMAVYDELRKIFGA